jgi:hypothetical protein
VYIIIRSTATGITADILRYSIFRDKIERVSSLSTSLWGGLPLLAKDGKTIYYFGDSSNPRSVHKFNSETNLTVLLPSELPSSVYYAGGVSINGTLFIFDRTTTMKRAATTI